MITRGNCKQMTHKCMTLLSPSSVLKHGILPFVLKTRRELNQTTAQHKHNYINECNTCACLYAK